MWNMKGYMWYINNFSTGDPSYYNLSGEDKRVNPSMANGIILYQAIDGDIRLIRGVSVGGIDFESAEPEPVLPDLSTLELGREAPEFTLTDTDGHQDSRSDAGQANEMQHPIIRSQPEDGWDFYIPIPSQLFLYQG